MPGKKVLALCSTRGSSLGSKEEPNSLLGKDMIAYVVSNKPMAPDTSLERAAKAGVPFEHVPNISKSQNRTIEHFEADLTKILEREEIDLIVMVGFMLVLSDDFVTKWQGRIINVHPSALPEFGGGMDLDVHAEVIKAKKKYSACTVHFATPVLDGGPKIKIKHCLVAVDETPDSLKAKVQTLEKVALVEAVLACQEQSDLFNKLEGMQAKFMPWQKSENDTEVKYTNTNEESAIYHIVVSKNGRVSIDIRNCDGAADVIKPLTEFAFPLMSSSLSEISGTFTLVPPSANDLVTGIKTHQAQPLYLVECLEYIFTTFSNPELFQADLQLFETYSKANLEALEKSRTLGILGGGQLGRMLAIAAANLGIRVKTLDPSGAEASAAQVSEVVNGHFRNSADVNNFAAQVGTVTIEVEHVDTNALQILSTVGHNIQPAPQTIATIQDKFAQKWHFESKGIPVAEYCEVSDQLSLEQSVAKFGYPLMLKSKRLAYDGRGNFVINSAEDHSAALEKLGGFAQGLYAEKMQKFAKELAVIVVRGSDGQMLCYPVTETIQRNSICYLTETPAQISPEAWKDAELLALKAVSTLSGAGAFGVEMFLMPDGNVILNEVAPRVHNSGHYTIDACETSQFENHVRAVMGMPLGSTKLKVAHTVMLNILGAANGEKGQRIANVLKNKANSLDACHLHWYNKKGITTERKVGHINIVGNDAKTVRAILNNLEANAYKLLPEIKPKPLVGIIMGSTSDLPLMEGAIKILEEFGIPFEVTVVSAHRTPDRLAEYGKTAHDRGLKVIIAGAGGAAHLPGMMAALTQVFTIGVPTKPPTASDLNGLDALYSIVQMPDGVPVATVGIGKSGNAGLLAVRLLAASNPELFQKLVARQLKITTTVVKQAEDLETMGYKEFLRIEAAKKEAEELKKLTSLFAQFAPQFKGMIKDTLQELIQPASADVSVNVHMEPAKNTLTVSGLKLGGVS